MVTAIVDPQSTAAFIVSLIIVLLLSVHTHYFVEKSRLQHYHYDSVLQQQVNNRSDEWVFWLHSADERASFAAVDGTESTFVHNADISVEQNERTRFLCLQIRGDHCISYRHRSIHQTVLFTTCSQNSFHLETSKQVIIFVSLSVAPDIWDVWRVVHPVQIH